MQNNFGSLFINNEKTLIHKYSRSTTRVAAYKEQIEIALQKAGEGLRISELETAYRKGNKNPGVIEALLLKRKTLNLPTDSLLDEYVSLLPADSLTSARTLLFIAQMAPLIGSKPDQALRKDRILFNKVWYSMDSPIRISINNRVIYKSMQKAIKEKNESFAYTVADFSRGVNSNPQAAAKAYSGSMLSYYKGINDTRNYLGRAISYYDDYFMTVDPDSVKARDSMNLKRLFAQKPTSVTTVKRNDTTFTRREVVYSPLTQLFTRDLNTGARDFYTMTSDSFYLQKALNWAKRANEFSKNPEAMDTYARLLYKTGNRSEAIEWMNKVIEWGKKINLPVQEYETMLSKMKSGSNKIDNY
jgi:tetratricopeptide (TPR) repeat protein